MTATTETGTRYQIEGTDENGQWSWSHVSSDGGESATIFDDLCEANAAALELQEIFQCDQSEIRVVKLD